MVRSPVRRKRSGVTWDGANLVAIAGVGGRKRQMRSLLGRLPRKPETRAGEVEGEGGRSKPLDESTDDAIRQASVLRGSVRVLVIRPGVVSGGPSAVRDECENRDNIRSTLAGLFASDAR